MDKAEGFEITEYSGTEDATKTFSALAQITKDFQRERPNIGIQLAFKLGQVRISYHASEIGLSRPGKLSSLKDDAQKTIGEFLKHLKKEFKKSTKHELKLKEDKSKEFENAQKTSLNERYYYVLCKFYELT